MRIKPKYIDIEDLRHFTKKQLAASRAVKHHKFILYGGAMGGGKSYWLRWQLITILFEFAAAGHYHVTVGLFCEDYPVLNDRQLARIKYEFPEWLGTYNATDHTFTLDEAYGGGVIAFRNLDDASKYQSAEFAVIAIDELTKIREEDFIFLRTRLRWPGIADVKFIAATNPGGVGHNWVKRLWIDRAFLTEAEREQFVYVPARVYDNPYLDPSYQKDLEQLPTDMRRAFLEGDWDIFQGQYFTEFRRDMHVIARCPVLREHRKFVALDYGYFSPAAALWCYKDADGVVYVYRELYRTGMTYDELAVEICAMTPAYETIEYCVADPSLWSKTGADGGLCGADLIARAYRKVRGEIMRMVPANNDRIAGWNLVREHLRLGVANGRIMPKLQICEVAANLIRTLPTLVHDPKNPEDVDTRGEDHAPDALRYALMSDPPKSPPAIIDGHFPPNLLELRLSIMVNRTNYPYQYPKPDPDEWE